MSTSAKRYRQSSIVESFGFYKKQKNNHNLTMTEKREVMAGAAERRITFSSFTENSIALKCSEENGESGKKEKCASVKKISGNNSSESLDTEELNFSGSTELLIEETDSEELLKSDVASSNETESLQNSSHSQELFPGCDDFQQRSETEIDNSWEEVRLSFLNRSPACSLPLPKLEPLENHSIMFSPHIRAGDAPRPFPSTYRDKWDSDHVRMPCSLHNRCPVEDRNGEKQICSRWDLICQSLSSDISSSEDLEKAIMKYNSQYIGRWNFHGLHIFLNMCLREEERDHFFETLLPAMIKMALELPNICTQPIPLLKKEKDHYLTLSQKQIGCLLLNAFFCTFPCRTLPSSRHKQRWNSEYSNYPDINFNRLFVASRTLPPVKREKFKCLFNYFKRITEKEPSGTVTFHRQYLEDLPKWHESRCEIKPVVIKSDGFIELEGHGMLQVDFANKYVGGGVLGFGCVQEEIRFTICPELIASRLFVERLANTEALIVTGVEQYNKYSGYADTFKWIGDFQDQTPRDSWGRRYTQLVAIDAMHFRNTVDQYKLSYLKRELNKAFCGFYEDIPRANLPSIATGNWGCGVYKGNPNLKFIIQLMAAAQSERSLLYFTFGNENLAKDLQRMYALIVSKNLCVGDLWRLLVKYSANAEGKDIYLTLPDFMYSVLSNKVIKYASHTTEHVNSTDAETIQNDIQKLIEDVENEDSTTEIEDNASLSNDPT